MTKMLFAYLGIILFFAFLGLLQRARRIDQVALPAFLLLAFATRPGAEQHRSVVVDAACDPATALVMQSTTARAAMAGVVTSRLVYHDFYVFTVGVYQSTPISLGLFGRVFVAGEGRWPVSRHQLASSTAR